MTDFNISTWDYDAIYNTILDLLPPVDEELGCTDESACNYNPDATEDDDSCWYAMEYHDCDGNTNVDWEACVEDCVDFDNWFDPWSIDATCESLLNESVSSGCLSDCTEEQLAASEIDFIIILCEDCLNNENYTCDQLFECMQNDASMDECGVCGGDGSSCTPPLGPPEVIISSAIGPDSSSILIHYDSNQPIAGFQFTVQGIGDMYVYDGDAAFYGLDVSNTDYMVLGYSVNVATIPAGTGTLVEIGGDLPIYCADMEAYCVIQLDNIIISNIVFSDENGDPFATCYGGGYGTCVPSEYETILGCMDPSACNFNPDVTSSDGSCYYQDVCMSIINVDIEAKYLDIHIRNSEPVGGFQFELQGLEIESAWGVLANVNGFEISFNSDMIMGYNLNAGSIPVGAGILAQISFSILTSVGRT